MSAAVREWAVAHGGDPRYRIALCGYESEHAMPEDWAVLRWKTPGGFGSQGSGRAMENASRETVWFSSFTLPANSPQLSFLEDAR